MYYESTRDRDAASEALNQAIRQDTPEAWDAAARAARLAAAEGWGSARLCGAWAPQEASSARYWAQAARGAAEAARETDRARRMEIARALS